MYFFYLLIACFSELPLTQRSFFGHQGIDEVENEFVLGLHVFHEVSTPTGLKSISEQFKNSDGTPRIDPDDYPWPGHDKKGTSTPENLVQEYNDIVDYYAHMANDRPQSQSYYHPRAFEQWYTTKEEMDKAKRYKIRYTLTGQYSFHVIPAWVPPGEIVTIELPQGVSLEGEFNVQIRNGHHDTEVQRLTKYAYKGIRFPSGTSRFSWPYGAQVCFWYERADPIDINISGVILCPYFVYGYHSDEDWEEVKNLPGPFTIIDTGNLIGLAYTKNVLEDYYRINDCMLYWRSFIQCSQTTARDCYGYNNPQFGRILHPCHMRYDTYVPAGFTVAYVGSNFVHAPLYWVKQLVNYERCSDNPWGSAHEIDHHHQDNWALAIESGEMSNNAVNLAVYSLQNLVSGRRETEDWGSYTYPSSRVSYRDDYGLELYSNMLQFFGLEKYKLFIQADQQNKWYHRETYGNAGSEMLRASRVYGRNMKYFYDTFSPNYDGKESLLAEELNKLGLKDKHWHPVCNIYTVGFILEDGTRILPARPYRIFPDETLINFNDIKSRGNFGKDKFGDFKLQSVKFEKGREGAWKKQKDEGIYVLTPKSNLAEIEEVIVDYLDTTTKEVTHCICQFTCMYADEKTAKLTRYGGIPLTEDNLFKAYKYVATNPNDVKILNTEYLRDDLLTPEFSSDEQAHWISVLEGGLVFDKEGNYTFAVSGERQMAFYLSENPLSSDPDTDEKYLIAFQNGSTYDYNTAAQGTIYLNANKTYHFRLVNFPKTADNRYGRSWVGYRFNNTGDLINVPGTCKRYFTPLSEEEKYMHQFSPKWQKIYGMDLWSGVAFKRFNQSNWNVYKVPNGETRSGTDNEEGEVDSNHTPTEFLTDGDPTTEYRVQWWPTGLDFNHTFEIDMGDMQSFKSLRLGKTGNMYYYPMNSYLMIYLAPYNYSLTNVDEKLLPEYSSSNYSINHEESLAWEGFYNNTQSEIIDFDKQLTGRYMKLVFINNSLKWKGENLGRTCISSIEIGTKFNNKKVYPMTNTKYITLSNRWDITNDGEYYNGKGYVGYAAGAAPQKEGNDNKKNSIVSFRIPKGKEEFGIIGDYHEDMGRASVKLDGKQVGVIGEESYDPAVDKRKLTKAHHSYKSLLFYINDMNPATEHTVTIEVYKGEITLAGILTQQIVYDYFTDDGSYEKILEDEFKQEKKKKGGLSGGAIAAIVIVVLLVAAAAGVGVFIMYKKQMFCFGYKDRGTTGAGDNLFNSFV